MNGWGGRAGWGYSLSQRAGLRVMGDGDRPERL